MTIKKRGLGRGLDALLAANNKTPTQQPEENINDEQRIHHIKITELQRGQYQPRKDMSEQKLEQLAQSIKQQGILQPIVIRRLKEADYEILAGERRWQAAKLLHLETVPCIIKVVDNQQAVAIALIENIQREELNVMEEARAFERLIAEFQFSHQQIAEAIGKSRSSVTNTLRLIQLNSEVKIHLEHSDIEMGHARALLGLAQDDQLLACQQVISQDLTVRETEKLVKEWLDPKPVAEKVAKNNQFLSFEQQLSQQLNTKVQIQSNAKGKGKLTISYTSMDELEKIISQIEN